jgi:hypothetical protein
MFKKFFGKKNDGFYMQVDDTSAPKTAPQAEAAKPVETKAIETAVVTETKEVAAVTTEATSTAAKAAAKTGKTSIKKQKAKEDKPAAEAVTAPVAQPVAVATFTNFATDYLVTPAVAGNRRRPGANMKGFMSMAKEVKVTNMSTGADIKAKKASKS